MSRVLVTGGSGFIGSHVVDRLIAAGHQPHIFDVRPSPYHPADEVPATLGDVCDIAALTRAMKGCDAVMHLAAAADVGEVAQAPVASEELNARGTLSVLQAARDASVARVAYASTIWVYSDVEADTVDEDTPLIPPGHLYTATKLAGELYCRSYAELYGLQYTILRFGIPYGPRARPAAVVPSFVGRALAGEPLTLAGTGEQSRRFVYVEDLAEGAVVAGLSPAAVNRTYNLVGGEDTTIREIAEAVRDLVGGVEIVRTEGRAGDFRGAEVSGARAEAELGWRPRTSFAEGLGRYVAWRREAEPPLPARREAGSRLPQLAGAFGDLSRRAALGLTGVAAGLLAAAIMQIDALDDPPGFLTVSMLLAITALALARVGWSRRARDGALVLAGMVGGVACGLLAVSLTPHVARLARADGRLLLMLVVAAALGAGAGRRLRMPDR